MGCGIKDENGDVCGATFTCGGCRSSEHNTTDLAIIRAQIVDLQEVVRLLAFHVGNKLDDPEAMEELDQATLGTPLQRI